MNLGSRRADVAQQSGLRSAIADFRAGCAAARDEAGCGCQIGDDGNLLFYSDSVDIRKVQSGDALIRRGEPDRTLYFVLRLNWKLTVQSSDGFTMGRWPVLKMAQSWGNSRFSMTGPSITSGAVTLCEVAAMNKLDQYGTTELASLGLRTLLLFALVIEFFLHRLRRTTARLAG